MISDVDDSLRELTRRDVLNGAQVEVSFEAPNRDWASRRSTPSLNFYLYDIREDLERRQVQYEEVRNEEGIVVDRVAPPRRFKLSYLVTAWTQRPEDEHRLLSAVISCFVRFDALPEEILQGDLARQPYKVRMTVGLPLPPERSLSDVWTALGGELKPSLDLIVTAPFSTGRHQSVGPPVLEEPRLTLSGPGVAEGDAPPAGEGGDKPARGGKRRRGKAEEPADPDEDRAAEAVPPSDDSQELARREALAVETVRPGRGRGARTLVARNLPRS